MTPAFQKLQKEVERESELFGQVIRPDLVGAASGLWLACRRFDMDPDHFILPSNLVLVGIATNPQQSRPEVEASCKMPKAPIPGF